MARNGSGVYSLPPGSTIANGDTSDATDVNTPLADIAADLNVARPVVAGGTGSTSASGARTNLGLTSLATTTPTDTAATIINGTEAPFIGNASVEDESIDPGFYAYATASGSSGGPTGVTTANLIHTRRAPGGGEAQILVDDTTTSDLGYTYTRSRIGGSWGAWLRTVTSVAPSELDADDITTSGWFTIPSSGASNTPRDGTGWFVQSIRVGATSMAQIAYANAADYTETAQRVMTSGVWSDWRFRGIDSETIATTSGDDLEWTSIPIYAKRIALHFVGVSLSAADHIRIQARITTTGIIQTGYTQAFTYSPSNATTTETKTDAFYLQSTGASDVFNGVVILERIAGTNTWSFSTNMSRGATVIHGGGNIALAGTLNGLRISSESAATFDAGSATAVWQT